MRLALWRSINPYHAGAIGMPELFDLYRSVFGSALGDDNIAILADRALNSHFLQTKGRVTREDLDKVLYFKTFICINTVFYSTLYNW